MVYQFLLILEVQQTLRSGWSFETSLNKSFQLAVFSLRVTHLGLELEGYDRGSR